MPDTNPATPEPATTPGPGVMAATDSNATAISTAGGQDEPDTVMADVPQESTQGGPNSNGSGSGASTNGNTAAGTPLAMAATVLTPTPVSAASVAHGDATRQYLNTHVTGAVLAGLKEIAKQQPQEPIRALGESLIRMADDMAKQNNY